ncbi:MAG: UvrD-helicase domain-containing protein [Akkermansiaceae bacterium]
MLSGKMNILAKNLLILASAGSGKTFQLGNRVIGLVAGGVAPERIVARTTT